MIGRKISFIIPLKRQTLVVYIKNVQIGYLFSEAYFIYTPILFDFLSGIT